MTPKFQPEALELRKVGTSLMLPAYLECEACGERALRDVETKLCRPCWRSWAFGLIGNLVLDPRIDDLHWFWKQKVEHLGIILSGRLP